MINQKEFDNRCIKMWKMVYLTYGMNFPLTWNSTMEKLWYELRDLTEYGNRDPTYLGIDSITMVNWVTRDAYALNSTYTFTQKFIDEVINATT